MRLIATFLYFFSHILIASDFSESRVHSLRWYGPELPDTWSSRNESPVVGLYVGKGTWQAGKEHLKMFFQENHWSYRTLSADDILRGEITKNRLRILVIPGGESWEYLKELGPQGEDAIKAFVSRGGGYVGICAGAFYATSLREGGYATGPYGIGLLDGTAYDGTALKIDPFIEGMMDFDFMNHFLISGLLSKYRIVMFGGPSFFYSEAEAQKKDIRVMARVQKINHPTMITFTFGSGRAFLSGPHLEIEEDRTDWGSEFTDPESDWPILHRAMEWIKGRGHTCSSS